METKPTLKIVLAAVLAALFPFVAKLDARHAATNSRRADVRSIRVSSNEISDVT
jgi:hypothetical protein